MHGTQLGGQWVSGTFPKLMPPKPYDSFADLVARIAGENWETVSVITFNYDLGLDHAFYFGDIPYTYGFSDAALSIDLLKLHGSLNWGRCSMCKEILALDMKTCLRQLRIQHAGNVKFEVSQNLPLLKHCGVPLKAEPAIVPPTWNKGTHHNQLVHVWRRAARHLSEAEYIFIIGYSYPPTDEFFRYLYALGSIGDGWLERIMVFNPDPNAGERVKALLGPLVRDKFAAPTNNFMQTVDYLKTVNFS